MDIEQWAHGLVKLTGTIKGYQATRAEANFVFNGDDRTKLGDAARAEESADYVEFELDGQSVRGWIWRSPFEEGDQVEVVAKWQDDHYEVAGIARPSDRIVALYPHCSRGKSRHVKNAVKWWLVGTTALLAVSALVFWIALTRGQSAIFFPRVFPYVSAAIYAFFGLATFGLARKWMPFVRLAEKVFVALGWNSPGDVDLVKTSKAQRKAEDPGEYGTFYFRY